MSIMPRFCAVLLTALLIPAAASAEDTTRGPNPAAAPTTTGSGVASQPELQAPVGHRQPRATDVAPYGRNAEDSWLNGINRDIDQRLRICRDC